MNRSHRGGKRGQELKLSRRGFVAGTLVPWLKHQLGLVNAQRDLFLKLVKTSPRYQLVICKLEFAVVDSTKVASPSFKRLSHARLANRSGLERDPLGNSERNRSRDASSDAPPLYRDSPTCTCLINTSDTSVQRPTNNSSKALFDLTESDFL